MAVLEVNYYSPSLNRNVPINVILPADKTDFDGNWIGNPPYPTLYLLHGIFGNYTDWIYGTRIVRWAQDHGLAVVMPSGDNRFYLNHEGGNDNYSDFIGKELPEITRRMFPLSLKREDTYIGGLSMGGWGALINGFRYPETFGGIAALSSAILVPEAFPDNDDGESILEKKSFRKAVTGHTKESFKGSADELLPLIPALAGKENQPRIYLGCGTEDEMCYPGNVQLRDLMNSLGYDVVWSEGPGGHDWDVWDREIEKVVNWISPDAEASMSSGNVVKQEPSSAG